LTTEVHQVAAGLRVVDEAVQSGVVPGAVVDVRINGEVTASEAFGWSQLEPTKVPMTTASVFDLASLTKPLATATIALALCDRGSLSLDEPVHWLLPELKLLGGAGATIRRLMSHSAGVPGWRPLYAYGRDRDSLLAALARFSPAYEPGSRWEYSCVGYVILGLALEKRAGQSLDALFDELVRCPAGAATVGYPSILGDVPYVSTETRNCYEEAMLDRAGMSFSDWREACRPGEVNDGNAWYALGGVSGNAGLFGTARDAGMLGQAWLDALEGNSSLLSRAAARLATSVQASWRGADRGLGWELQSSRSPQKDASAIPPSSQAFFPPAEWDESFGPRSSGELLGSTAFGHTGFTGTSLWVDPEAHLVATLLTNSTHPRISVNGRGIRSLRARFHNALVSAKQSG
jgi:serine-type D-Ala-D-Ala carboxypeptidase